MNRQPLTVRGVPAITALLASLLLFGCSDDPPAGIETGPVDVRTVHPGEAFDLSVGQRARIGEDGLVVGFLGVREDTRCPIDVECVWAGDGAVALEVYVGRKAARTVTLHTTLEPRSEVIGDLLLRLVDLAPVPVSTRPIDPGDYVATLTVERRREEG